MADAVARSNTAVRSACGDLRDRPLGGALGAGHAAPQLLGPDVGCREQLRGAEEGLLDHEPRPAPRRSPVPGGLGELLDQEEDVGRAGARDRRQRVHLLLGHLDHGADGLEQRRARARCPRPTPGRRRRARSPPRRTIDGRVRHRAEHRRSARATPTSSIVTPAARLTTSASGSKASRELAQQVGHHRGLDADQHESRPAQGGPVGIRILSRSRAT